MLDAAAKGTQCMENVADMPWCRPCAALLKHRTFRLMVAFTLLVLGIVAITMTSIFIFQRSTEESPVKSATDYVYYPKADTRAHCEWKLSENLGVLMYWNTTFKPARAWLDLCYRGCLYDPYANDPWTDAVRAWYDGTAEKILQEIVATLPPKNQPLVAPTP
jgi:hypothetical protein